MINTLPDQDEEFCIYVERMTRMIQLLRIYELVLRQSGAVDTEQPHLSLAGTMLAVVYSFYYSLIEERENGIDFFRIWKRHAPEFTVELEILESRVAPLRENLRVFRNRYGFHGSTSREHESVAFDLLSQHSGNQLMDTILEMRNLSTRLLNAIGVTRDAESGQAT